MGEIGEAKGFKTQVRLWRFESEPLDGTQGHGSCLPSSRRGKFVNADTNPVALTVQR